MIISFGGAPGSGKSTIAQRLADKLGWPRYYMGGLWREISQKRGLTLVENLKKGEADPITDKEIDEYQAELGKNQDNFVIEGRTSWYFIPHSLKIYLDVSGEEGAKRIFGSLQKGHFRNEDHNLSSWENVMASNKERMGTDRIRYSKYYKVDVFDPKNFDFYLDTTNLTPDQVFQAVYDWVRPHLDNKKN
jgi:predicted cytidylate kinase